MAFAQAWVETDPDGAVIRVSQLDDSDRTIKIGLRERLEGDPATPDLTGLIEVGSFAAAPKPRKGAARFYVDTDANILAFGATKREDGRFAVASDTKRLYHVATAGVVEIAYLPLAGGTMTGAIIPMSGSITGAAGNVNIANGLVVNGSGGFGHFDNGGYNIFTAAGSSFVILMQANSNNPGGGGTPCGALILEDNRLAQVTGFYRGVDVKTTFTVAGAHVTPSYTGLYVRTVVKAVAQTITTHYGLYLEDVNQGGTNYAIYTNLGDVRFGGKFGCNAAAPQAALASGGALAAYVAGANGLDTGAHMASLHALVVSIRAALVANGIMS